jgi:hypothetical protein
VQGLDQLPDALLPLIVFVRRLDIGAIEITGAALAFMLLDLLVMPFRQRP